MEFTQIQEISSFSRSTLRDKNSHFNFFNTYKSQPHSKQQVILDEPFFHEVMKNLEDHTTAQLTQPLQSVPQSNDSQLTEDKNIRQTNQTDKKHDQNSEPHKKYDRTKSIMFNSSFTSRHSLRESKNDSNFIKVFYFNTPIMKLIPYKKISTIRQLIQRCLDTYLLENNDTIRANQPVEKFQMRLPNGENEFCSDMNIEPIHNDRVLSENMFETLVLVQKSKKETLLQRKPTKQHSFDESNMSYSSSIKSQIGSAETIKFILMDETYFELMRIELEKDGNLEKLFTIVQQNQFNDFKEFVIKDDPQSEFDLSPDHEVKLIQRNRLYLMTKKYLDEAQDETPAPIRLKTFIQPELNYLPPIGINEASRYEEFQVTKINSLGIAIDRILGIDQTKIYNYQKQLRQQKRQASIMDTFFGFNIHTGTKKPFRFIKQITDIKKFHGGIEVIYPDKTTTFIIKNELSLEKIYRKLSFLLDLNKVNQPGQKANTSQTISSKKNRSFFKF